jgi:hypothetical protein
MAMMAMTTSNSIKVKAGFRSEVLAFMEAIPERWR